MPAFVGWTERADNRGRPLHLQPWRIGSMTEFQQYFGGAPTAGHVRFTLAQTVSAAPANDLAMPLGARDAAPWQVGSTNYSLRQTAGHYLLYHAMALFFQNGGGPCYVVSAGEYGREVDAASLAEGVQALEKEREPTLLVVPDAVLLKQADCQRLQRQMLQHCGEMKNRLAILDVWEGYRPRADNADVVGEFRDGVGDADLSYGAAYHPWLNATVVQARELTHRNLAAGDSLDALIAGLHEEIAATGAKSKTKAAQLAEVGKLETVTDEAGAAGLAAILISFSTLFEAILNEMTRRLNLLPPAAALAGVYTAVDNSRGVWRAPANVGLAGVSSPAVPLSSEQQEDLNVTPSGKSINAIRSFVGEGLLVWGARTLDGNSLDWRYVNVRRTMIMLEESIRLAAQAYVFEPNTAATWTTLKAMVNHFLTDIWKRGGLAGVAPEDAFDVQVGLGETMTPDDVQQGILRMTVRVAVSRPAEFIEVTFQQQMPTG